MNGPCDAADSDQEEPKRDEDEGNAGCILEGLGYVGLGCLSSALPCVTAFMWFVS